MRANDNLYDELSRVNNELVNLQRKLAKQNAALEELGRLNALFLAMAAHDLRRPIGSVMAYSEMLEDELSDLSDEHRQFLGTIHRAARRMNHLVEDYLSSAQASSGRLVPSRQPICISSIVSQAIQTLAPAATRAKLQVKVEGLDELAPLPLDGPKIEQVVLNILGNCVDHCGPGATVRIRGRELQGLVALSFCDDGPGIPSAVLASLELRDNQVPRLGPPGRRAGLGLFIARELLDAHGGRLLVNSRPGEGSTLTIELPRSQ